MNKEQGLPIWEKYRPQNFDEVVGQDKAIKKIKRILERGIGGRMWWISGASGVGKTTIARIIAAKHANGISECSAGDVKVDLIEKIGRKMPPLMNRAYIINEAHGLRKIIIQRLLNIEPMNKSWVLVFTTTKTGHENLLEAQDDAQPLLSRCNRIKLTNQGLAEPFAKQCKKIAESEGIDGKKPLKSYVKLAQKCNNNLRMMLTEIETGCMLD